MARATSMLDVALLRDIPYPVTSLTMDCVGSDHYPVLLAIHANPVVCQRPPRFNYTKANWAHFRSEVHNGLEMQRFKSPQSVDSGVEHLTQVIQKAMHASIPKTSAARKPDPLPPHLLALKRQKNAAKRRWVKYRRPQDRTAFNYSKALLQTELRAWRDTKWAKMLIRVSNHTDVWKLSKALKQELHSVPPLLGTAGNVAQTDEEKAQTLSSASISSQLTNKPIISAIRPTPAKSKSTLTAVSLNVTQWVQAYALPPHPRSKQ